MPASPATSRRGSPNTGSELADGFTKKYGVKALVWYEPQETMQAAIQREKNIKVWKRAWKIELIERSNPNWTDLFDTLMS